jgi:hypothetical protein
MRLTIHRQPTSARRATRRPPGVPETVSWLSFGHIIAGMLGFIGLVGIGTGSGTAVVNLGFSVAVILGWAWLTLLLLHARTEEVR